MTIMPWTGPGMNPEQPWGTPQGLMGPRRRGGLFGSAVQQPAMTAVEQPQKPGFDWRKLLGVVGDSLAIAGGGQAQYVPSLIEQRQRQQAQAYAEQQYQRRRQDENTDWQARQKFEAENRAPTYFDDNAGNRWAIGADGQPKLAFRDPTQKYVQQVVTDPDGSQRLIQVPVPNNVRQDGTFDNAVVGGGGRPAIGAVVADPRKAGGQSVAPAGNFPR